MRPLNALQNPSRINPFSFFIERLPRLNNFLLITFLLLGSSSWLYGNLYSALDANYTSKLQSNFRNLIITVSPLSNDYLDDAAPDLFLVNAYDNNLNMATNYTINSGLWSNPAIWSDGVPDSDDVVVIKHPVSASGMLNYNSLTIEEGTNTAPIFLNIAGTTIFENDITNNGIFRWTNGGLDGGPNCSTLTNNGTLEMNTIFNPAIYNTANTCEDAVNKVDLNFVNTSSGTVIKGGSDGYQNIFGSFLNEGEIIIKSDKGIAFFRPFVNSGSVTVEADGAMQFRSTDLTLNGGIFSGAGRLEFVGDNTISVLNPAVVAIVTQSVILVGSLDVIINYPNPENFDKVTIIDAESLTGTFTTVSLLPQYWTLKYNYPNTGEVTLEYEVPDADGDGWEDNEDNCPNLANADQADNDFDGLGDICDEDDDNDGILDSEDNCVVISNSDQLDSDYDGIGDVCDICPLDADNDIDGDGICGNIDNCPTNPNEDQIDSDCDGVGDVCDVCDGGDDSVDNNNDGIADCSQILSLDEYSDDWKCGNNNNKIIVCHKPPGNPSNTKSLCISINALESHLNNHGDFVGPCVECSYEDEAVIDYDAVDPIGFIIYPNPALTNYNIDITDLVFSTARINVYNVQMVLVNVVQISESNRNNVMNFLTNNMQPGIYFVVITADSDTYVNRLVID